MRIARNRSSQKRYDMELENWKKRIGSYRESCEGLEANIAGRLHK